MKQAMRCVVWAAVLVVMMEHAPCATAQTGTNVAERYLFAAANQDRAEHGTEPVIVDEQLARAARAHAVEMVHRRMISHQFAGEPGLAARGAAAGAHFSLITENVAEAPDASKINDLWMASAGHRANLLDPKVNAVGIAVILEGGEYYAVEDFARTVSRLSIAQEEEKVGQMVSVSGVGVLPASEAARQTCAMQQGFAGGRQPWFVMRYTTSDLSRLPVELTDKLRTGKYHQAEIGACAGRTGAFTGYRLAVLLFP